VINYLGLTPKLRAKFCSSQKAREPEQNRDGSTRNGQRRNPPSNSVDSRLTPDGAYGWGSMIPATKNLASRLTAEITDHSHNKGFGFTFRLLFL